MIRLLTIGVRVLTVRETVVRMKLAQEQAGVPPVPSALPRVRPPMKIHGMGKVSEIGNSESLAAAILKVLGNPEKYKGDVSATHTAYNRDSIAHEYEKLFAKLMRKQ